MGPKVETQIGDRQIRKHVWGKPHRIELRFPRGFTREVSREILALLAAPQQGYSFQAELIEESGMLSIRNIHFRQIFELLFSSRTLRDLLWVLGEKRVGSYGELAKFTASLPWEILLGKAVSVSLKVRSLSSRLFHEGGIAEVVTETLQRNGVQVRPAEAAESSLEIIIQRNSCRFLLSCFGSAGYRRHFKKSFIAIAPIREDLAACLFERLKAFSNPGVSGKVLAVPFAGSGTLAVEGLLSLSGLPSGIFGREYAYEKFPCTSVPSNKKLKERILSGISEAILPETVIAIERDETQAEALKINLENAWRSLSEVLPKSPTLEITRGDFASSHFQSQKGSIFPFNPPFGERLGVDVEAVYGNLGLWTGNHSTNSGCGFLLSADKSAEKAFIKNLPMHSAEFSQVIHGGKRISCLLFRVD